MMAMTDIAVSSGSACTSVEPEPSHVLLAMGRTESLARASLRFGLGRFTTKEEVDFAADYVAEAVSRLRSSRHGFHRPTHQWELTVPYDNIVAGVRPDRD